MNVVFMEGFWGVVIMSFIALPILYITPQASPSVPPYTNTFENGAVEVYTENVLDAFVQIYNNRIFLYENLIYVFSIAFYNFFGLALTSYLSAVHRTLIDACRTISVWMVQVLFYFIGMQDNDDPSAVNIIQPVLTWGNGHKEWYLQSWACCPKNITVNSPPLFGLQPGSQVGGTIVRVRDSTWKIDSEFNGKHTTLNAQVGDYIYNWADVTLEIYYVSSCSEFATGKAYFNNLVLTDKQGQTLSPKWTFTGASQCSGKIVQSGAAQIFIQHG